MKKIITILFIISTLTSSSKDNYVKDEIIINLKEKYLLTALFDSEGEFFKINNTINNNRLDRQKKTELFSILSDSTGGSTYIRKLFRKYKLKDTISISRSGKMVDMSEILRTCIVKLNSDTLNIIEVCHKLNKLDYIITAEPNFIEDFTSNYPNDTFYNTKQRGLEQGNDIDIDVENAWNFTKGNSGIKVGVIDNGIDYDHPDLGNGLFGASGAKVRGGWDYHDNDSDPDFTHTDCSHGTEVAGIIGAYTNNSIGIAGIAGGNGLSNTGCQLFALKVGGNDCDGLSTSDIIEAIIDGSSSSPGYGCHILNNSYGKLTSTSSWTYSNAVLIAAKNNVVFVAAKGNNNSNGFFRPADFYPHASISVGATDINDERVDKPGWWGSNIGNGIDVAAPGVLNLIYTTEPLQNGTYTQFNGTSAAAPIVSGQAALILSEALSKSVSLHHNDVEGLIKYSAEDVNHSDKPGYDDDIGHGRVNIGRSLEMMNKPWKMTHHFKIGGTIVNSQLIYNHHFINNTPLPTGNYDVIRHEVHNTITMPNYINDGFIWCRTSNESKGWSNENPNKQNDFSQIHNRSGNSVTLKTYVYQVIHGLWVGYYPVAPNNVVFKYTTLGIPCYEDLHLHEPIYETTIDDQIVYSVSDEITASNKINIGADVKFKAGNEIKLWSGFEAQRGSEFNAKIESCTETLYKTTNFIEQTGGVKENKPTNNLSIHPNPITNTSEVILKVSESVNSSLLLYDNIGNENKVFFKNKILDSGKYNYTLDGSKLNSGMYFLILKLDDKIISKKVMNVK